MNKSLYIHSGNENDIVNLVFEPSSVVLRTFQRIRNAEELNTIIKRENYGEDITKYYKDRNSYGLRDMDSEEYKNELNKINNAYKNALQSVIKEEDLKTTKNLQGKFVKVDGEIYRVAKQSKFKLDKACWQPYSEVCMSLMKNASRYPERHNLVFFDRNSQTYFGREDFSQFHKKFRITDSYIAFRWFVLPGTSLLTAPVIVDSVQKIITNLNLDSEIIIGSGGIVTDSQKDRVDSAIYLFRKYWIPQVVIEGQDKIKAGETVTFNITCTHEGGKICTDTHEYELQMISGYAPHTRIQVIKGKGNFRVTAFGLYPGEEMRFKINDKYWANKAEKTLKVI